MPELVIEKDQWKTFCESFTRRHELWLVSLEAFPEDIPHAQAELMAEGVPLQSVSYDREGLFITAGEDEDTFTHRVENPLQFILIQTANGSDEALRIEEGGGKNVTITFQSHEPPEDVSGLE